MHLLTLMYCAGWQKRMHCGLPVAINGKYIDYWRDTPMEDAFNVLINEKQITIGGTSAGCAIMGQAYFSAENGTIISNTALHNPYHNLVQLGNDDFFK
jgi:cyanophycinase